MDAEEGPSACQPPQSPLLSVALAADPEQCSMGTAMRSAVLNTDFISEVL